MVNRTIIQGRLTKDPELKKTQSDVAYTEVTVAWSETYKDVETKCFLPVQAWRHNAEFLCKYFGKGKEVVVEGRLKTSEWTDKDGNNRSRLIMIADQFHFCGPKTDNNSNKDAEPTDDDGFMNIPDNADDEGLPINFD